MLESQDPASPKSACSSVTIKSASSGHLSGASSQLRVMRVQSQAKAAALKKKLEAARITHKLQRKVNQPTNAIEQQKIQAEIDAAEAEEQVIAYAIKEEEEKKSRISLLDQSEPIIQPALPQPAIQTPQPTNQNIVASPNLSTTSVSSTKTSHHTITSVAQTQPANTPVSMAFHHSYVQHQPAVQLTAPSSQNALADNSNCYQQSIFTPNDYAEAINPVRQRPAKPPMFLGDPMAYQD